MTENLSESMMAYLNGWLGNQALFIQSGCWTRAKTYQYNSTSFITSSDFNSRSNTSVFLRKVNNLFLRPLKWKEKSFPNFNLLSPTPCHRKSHETCYKSYTRINKSQLMIDNTLKTMKHLPSSARTLSLVFSMWTSHSHWLLEQKQSF